ncbi:MAG: flagellar biosynthesis protein FlhA [Desulfobacteraceae bacterium]|nr:flagellar biosynthesis protein FlhA [Desulfobacteraceae bacterium]
MELVSENILATQFARFTRNSDILMAGAVIAILLIMVVPLPSFLLDLLLSFNITFSLVILMVGMYIRKPLELSSFPSLLLITTLFRLSLNVASTRMILLHGNEGVDAAGKVIMAFGNFVVGGNYIVGVIVFLILVVINFMVITKGAGRIAEVAARFTLDAMPGKQMSIDADLNAGLINDQEAKARRRQVAQEAEYYGAMDGANKFVRGDAIAGIIINLINIIAGLCIGVFYHGMNFSDAAQSYTLLTVGDGLVSQMPALIISTAAGIIVSRAGSESSMGKDVSSQIFAQPRAIAIAAVVLFLFAMIPGLPTIPFLVLSILAGSVAYILTKTGGTGVSGVPQVQGQAAGGGAVAAGAASSDSVKLMAPLDILALEVGYGLIPLVDAGQNGELLERIKSVRRQIAQEIGILVPSVHIQDNMQLKPGEYCINLKGNEVARGDLMLNHYLALNPAATQEKIDGIPTKEPTFGLPAYWIREQDKEKIMSQGFTVVDLATVLTTHLTDIIKKHAHEYLGRQEVQQLLDTLKETYPRVVDELVPNLLPLGTVVKVLQNLLVEQIPIRDLLTILETLADWAPAAKDPDTLTEYVRHSLARTITRLYASPDGALYVMSLDHQIETLIFQSLQQTAQGSYLSIEPDVSQKIVRQIARGLDKFTSQSLQPVLLCSTQIRSQFHKLVDRFIPSLVVLSYNDVLSNIRIQSLGIVRLTDAD